MNLQLHVHHDYIQIGDGQHIPRPVHVSRSRWTEFWQTTGITGITSYRMQQFLEMIKHCKVTEEEFMQELMRRP